MASQGVRSGASRGIVQPMVALLALLAVQAGQPASGQTLVGTISRSGWAPTSLALHRPGGLLLVGDSNSASVFAFDARTLAARGSVAVDLLRVSDLVVDEASGRAFASCFGIDCGDVAVIDLGTMAPLGVIDTDTNTKLAQDQTLGKVYALHRFGFLQVDAGTLTTVANPAIHGNINRQMAVNPVTHEVFISTFMSGGIMDIVDGITLQHTTVPDLAGLGVGVNWIENKVYTTYGFQVYDRDTGSVTALQSYSDTTSSPVFSPVTNRMYAGAEVNSLASAIDGPSDQLVDFPMLGGRTGLAVHEAAAHVFFNGNPLALLDEASGIIELMALPPAAPTGLSYSTDDIVVDQSSGVLYALNGGNVEVVQDFRKLTRPSVYVGDAGTYEVYVLDPVGRAVVDDWGGYGQPGSGLAARPGGAEVLMATQITDNVVFWTCCGNKSHLANVDSGGSDPVTVAIAPDGRTAYVTNADSGTVGVLDTESMTLAASFATGGKPWGAAVSADGETLYISDRIGGRLLAYRTSDRSLAASIAVGADPRGVALSPSGSRVYVANAGTGTVSTVDTALNAVVATVTVGGSPHWLAVSPDGRRLFVTNTTAESVCVIDTETAALAATVPLAATPEGLAILPDGSAVFVATGATVTVIAGDGLATSVVALPPSASWWLHNNAVAVAVATPTGRFAGTVRSGAGLPLAGATVAALQGGQTVASSVSDSTGAFSVFDLAPGTYDIAVSCAGYAGHIFAGQAVAAGRTVVIDPVLPRSGRLGRRLGRS